MSEAIIVAVVTGVLSLAGTLGGSFLAQRKSAALVAHRLRELEKKVDKHNNLVERMTIAERDIKFIQDDIDEIKDELKSKREVRA